MLVGYLLLAAPFIGYVVWHTTNVVLSAIARGRSQCLSPERTSSAKIALLYPTCDDFSPVACTTLLNQKNIEFDLFILDDSADPLRREQIDDWVCRQDRKIQIVRRSNRSGYKGGNINHWLVNFGDPKNYPYVFLVDADECIPPYFVHLLQHYLQSDDYAFVQGVHTGTAGLRTSFQELLHAQVECEWFHQVPARNLLGLPFMLGHGVLLRTESLLAVNGFPDLISEDLALTIAFAEKGFQGLIALTAVGEEEFPPTYRAYWKRRWRWIRSDVELLRKMLGRLLRIRVRWPARLDLLMRELRYPLSPAYWLLLFAVAVTGCLSSDTGVTLPALAWLTMPLLLMPALPALSFTQFSLWRRFLYVLAVTFVGTASSALHPVACCQGFLGYRGFEPTGSEPNGVGPPGLVSWELFSALLFFAGGLLSHNWSLIAVSLAIGCSPLMRTRWEMPVLVVGMSVFWGLICFQIVIDVSNGLVPLEHLLVLVGLIISVM